MHGKSLQSCLTPCHPRDCSPPGSSVQGILRSRILGWVAMPSSRGSSRPRDRTRISYASCMGRRVLYQQGSPHWPRFQLIPAPKALPEPPGTEKLGVLKSLHPSHTRCLPAPGGGSHVRRGISGPKPSLLCADGMGYQEGRGWVHRNPKMPR